MSREPVCSILAGSSEIAVAPTISKHWKYIYLHVIAHADPMLLSVVFTCPLRLDFASKYGHGPEEPQGGKSKALDIAARTYSRS